MRSRTILWQKVETTIDGEDTPCIIPGDNLKMKPTNVTKRSIVLAFALTVTVILSYYVGFSVGRSSKVTLSSLEASSPFEVSNHDITNPCSDTMIPKPVPTFKNRGSLGKILEQEKMTVGVELGVQRGLFTRGILNSWPSCTYYLLVDIWTQQKNYKDSANFPQDVQNRFYNETLKHTDSFKDKRHICRNFTSVCVEEVADGFFDFIYVDARHDFKGVYEDLVAWWPKLRAGGIMAGHDYVTQDDGPAKSKQDWTTNYDGTKDETGTVVKGAVDKFSAEVCRQLTIGYRESGSPSWAMRK